MIMKSSPVGEFSNFNYRYQCCYGFIYYVYSITLDKIML